MATALNIQPEAFAFEAEFETCEEAGLSAETLHRRLLCRGIRTVLVRCCRGLGARLAFLFTALQQPAAIDRVIGALDDAMSGRAIKLSARTS